MNIINQFRERMAEKRLSRITDNSDSLFQVCEHDGKLWVTYAGNLVLPCDMLNVEPIEALHTMRTLYTERLTN